MNGLFRFRYAQFKELLVANSELLNTLSEIDEKLKGESVFGITFIRKQANKALQQAFQMTKCLCVMSGGKYKELYSALERINLEIKTILAERKIDQVQDSVMPYGEISLKDADWVGGKSANLGEIANNLHIAVPQGFAITTKAFHTFLEHNDLKEEIIKLKNQIYTDEIEQLNHLSTAAHDLIKASPLPAVLEDEIHAACTKLWGENQKILLAMRSSAVGEDGEISFAGQYLTLLGLTRSEVCTAYKEIVASLYSARSLSYRSSKGVHEEDLAMAVACLEMVDSKASGVLYTRHPYDIINEHILIKAVCGLGP